MYKTQEDNSILPLVFKHLPQFVQLWAGEEKTPGEVFEKKFYLCLYDLDNIIWLEKLKKTYHNKGKITENILSVYNVTGIALSILCILTYFIITITWRRIYC